MFGAVARGQAASSVLCAANNVQLVLVDVGVDADVQLQQQQDPSSSAGANSIVVMHRKVSLNLHKHGTCGDPVSDPPACTCTGP
jgi:hypothetical protein